MNEAFFPSIVLLFFGALALKNGHPTSAILLATAGALLALLALLIYEP